MGLPCLRKTIWKNGFPLTQVNPLPSGSGGLSLITWHSIHIPGIIYYLDGYALLAKPIRRFLLITDMTFDPNVCTNNDHCRYMNYFGKNDKIAQGLQNIVTVLRYPFQAAVLTESKLGRGKLLAYFLSEQNFFGQCITRGVSYGFTRFQIISSVPITDFNPVKPPKINFASQWQRGLTWSIFGEHCMNRVFNFNEDYPNEISPSLYGPDLGCCFAKK